MCNFKNFLNNIISFWIKSSIETASPEQAVSHLLPPVALFSSEIDKGMFQVSIAAWNRLMSFPIDVRLEALLKGLESKDTLIQAACADRLLYWRDTRIFAAMLQHINDKDNSVAWSAKAYITWYNGINEMK